MENLTVESEGGGGTNSEELENQKAKSTSSMFCVKWNGFANQVRDGLASLFGTEELVDVTLASVDGQRIRAHKIVLAMSSPFFRRVLKDNPCKHPIVIISGIKFRHVEHVIRFIYLGEVRMREDEVEDFIDAAESLKIDGIGSTVNQFDTDDLTDETIVTSPSRSGVIKRNESAISKSISPSSQSEGSPKLLKEREIPASESKSTGFEEISPAVSPRVRPISNLNSHSTPSPPWRSPPYSLSLSSPWSASHSHKAAMELFEIHRTDSSSSGGSPGVIVELKDEAANSVHSESSGESRGRHRIKSEEKVYELSLPESQGKSRETSPRLSVPVSTPSPKTLHGSPMLPYPGHRSPWSTEFPFLPFRTPHYLPLSLVAASAMLSGQQSPGFRPGPTHSAVPSVTRTSPNSCPGSKTTVLTSTPSHTSTFSHDYYRQQLSNRHHHHNASNNISSGDGGRKEQPSSLTTLRAKLTASMFTHGNSPHFIKPNSRGGLNALSTKPRSRTTTIRSSQVPQSSRYTATEVDEMVEKVENFPGPLVPCTVCQKFVKRERLRAHIHECHLLQGESIICPHCGIGLKSKGSFRVHIWRHKRGSLGVKKLRDQNQSS